MVDQRHLAVQRQRAACAIGRHQRAVAAAHPPVDLGVLIGVHVEDRDPVEFGAVDVGRYSIDHRIPAVAGLQIKIRGGVTAGPPGLVGGILGAVIKRIECGDEFGAQRRREGLMHGLLAPRRPCLVDFEMQPFGDRDERIFVGRMQPAAAEVEGDVGAGLDGVAAPADAVARFQHDNREAGVCQRVRGAEAGGARADDGDIDFGGEGHASLISSSCPAFPGTHVLRLQYPKRKWPGQARP